MDSRPSDRADRVCSKTDFRGNAKGAGVFRNLMAALTLVVVAACLAAIGCGKADKQKPRADLKVTGEPTPISEPKPSPMDRPIPTPTAAPTATPRPEPTARPGPSPTPSPTAAPPVGLPPPVLPPEIKPPDPAGETYDKTRENPFTSAALTPFSTFSVDVDTAAYTNVRRFLNEGRKPVREAVRIEEMINFFKYEYAEPDGPHPLALFTEMARCPWNEKRLIARIGMQAKQIDDSKRPPLNLVFLVDTSGSMAPPNRLPLFKQGLTALAKKLKASDRVSIVTYAGSVSLTLEPTPGNQTDKILEAINKLNAGGSTYGSGGIEVAYRLAEDGRSLGAVNRVILGTDGDFNVGITDRKELIKLIEDKRHTGVYLTILGFGRGNLKDATMESLAHHGNGQYAYVDTLDEAERSLNTSQMIPVARDVKIQVEFNAAKVGHYRLIGYDNRMLEKKDFEDDTKDAGDMGAGHQVTAIYEIILRGEDDKVEVKDKEEWGDAMMKVNLRYIPPSEKKSILMQQPMSRNDQPIAKASSDFRFAAGVAAFGMVLRETQERGSASFDMADALARSALGRDPGAYRAEFLTLIEKARKVK